jgi:hypothetical protein
MTDGIETQRLSLSGATLITPTVGPIQETDPEMLASIRTFQEMLENPPTQADINAQIARQRADKAHTVYFLNGEVIGMQGTEGGTTFKTNPGIDVGALWREAAAKGLSEDGARDYVAEQVGAALKERYGSALTVETYDGAANAPTAGQVEDAMFRNRALSTSGYGGGPRGGPLTLNDRILNLFSKDA